MYKLFIALWGRVLFWFTLDGRAVMLYEFCRELDEIGSR